MCKTKAISSVISVARCKLYSSQIFFNLPWSRNKKSKLFSVPKTSCACFFCPVTFTSQVNPHWVALFISVVKLVDSWLKNSKWNYPTVMSPRLPLAVRTIYSPRVSSMSMRLIWSHSQKRTGTFDYNFIDCIFALWRSLNLEKKFNFFSFQRKNRRETYKDPTLAAKNFKLYLQF